MEQNTNTANNKEIKQLNIVTVLKAMTRKWYLYLIWLPIAFGISCAIILPVPRSYTSTVKLAPELKSATASGSLSSLASSFGLSLGNKLGNTDAILPELYPDVINSVDFRTRLFKLKVTDKDGKVTTTYYDHLANRQKSAWWQDKINDFMERFDTDTIDAPNGKKNGKNEKVDPFRLTKRQTEISNSIGTKIKCTVDKKNFVISISVSDQDPLISATIADSVKSMLQAFITEYRTKKAKLDVEYALGLEMDAKKEYEKARRAYAAYSDSHQDLALQEYQSQLEDLENEMQLRYNAYTAHSTQLQAARAKLREETPAFTQIQSATVPIKPSAPKRMIFCGIFLLFTFIVVTIYAGVKYDPNKVKKGKKEKKKNDNTNDTTPDENDNDNEADAVTEVEVLNADDSENQDKPEDNK